MGCVTMDASGIIHGCRVSFVFYSLYHLHLTPFAMNDFVSTLDALAHAVKKGQSGDVGFVAISSYPSPNSLTEFQRRHGIPLKHFSKQLSKSPNFLMK